MAIFVEINVPPHSIFEKVGFNDQGVIKTIMDGTDEERRGIDAAKKNERESSMTEDRKSLDFTVNVYDKKT